MRFQVNFHVFDIRTFPNCANIILEILQKMDMSVKPCEDFYQYSCGGFVKRNYIPDEDNALNSFNFVGKEVQNRLRGLLEDNDLRKNYSEVNIYKILLTRCLYRWK